MSHDDDDDDLDWDADPELEAMRAAHSRRSRLVALIVAIALAGGAIAGLWIALTSDEQELPSQAPLEQYPY